VYNDLLWDTMEMIRVGGWVMYPLLITCLWMWYLIVKKTMDLRFYMKGWMPAQTCIDNAGNKDRKCALWQRRILDGFLAERTEMLDLNGEILDSLKSGQIIFIQQEISTIAMLATIAPLLGLLGTVSGMVHTFSVIAEFGTGNAKGLAGGISEALLTTQAGLVISVPGLFMVTMLTRRANRLLEEIRRFSLQISRAFN
jgi:biopolymer transport protein ExbB